MVTYNRDVLIIKIKAELNDFDKKVGPKDYEIDLDDIFSL